MIEIVKKVNGYVVRKTTARGGRNEARALRHYGRLLFGEYDWFESVEGDHFRFLWLAKWHAKRITRIEREYELERIRRQSHVDHTVWTLPDAS